MGNGNSIAFNGEDQLADHSISPEREIRRADFPKNFVFGCSTSSYQIEGGATEGRRGSSIWDDFTLKTPENIADGKNGNVAANHYNMYKDDVSSMKQTGLNAYRFSISWSRVLPGGDLSDVNQDGINFYNDLINTILAEGMQPYVTLFHWDLPSALESKYGGFLSKKIVKDFCDFAELCFWKFGDRVKHWITINEAWTYTVKGYCWGKFPPGRGSFGAKEIVKKMVSSVSESRGLTIHLEHELEEYIGNILQAPTLLDAYVYVKNSPTPKALDLDSTLSHEIVKDMILGTYLDYKTTGKKENCSQGDPSEPYTVAHNFLLAHAAAVNLYKKKFQGSQGGEIGMTNNANWYLPYQEDNEDDKEAAKRALDFMLGWFVAPLITGDYPQSMRKRVKDRLPQFTDEERNLVIGSYDFLGVNYYTTYYALSLSNLNFSHDSSPHYDLDQEVFSTPTRNEIPIGHRAGSNWLYIYPKGIQQLLVDIKNRYGNPLIYITENGVDENTNKNHTLDEARHDPMRVKYHNDHLWYMKEAIKDGANVKAYFIWSFADNFEWDEGYTVRFGIFYVDFINGRYTRHPKDSALWWMNFLCNAGGEEEKGEAAEEEKEVVVPREEEQEEVDVSEEVEVVNVDEEVEVEAVVDVDEVQVDVDEDEEVEVDECEEVPVDVDEEVDVDEDEEVNVDVNEEVDVDENEEVEVEVEVDEREEVPVDVDEEVDVDEDEEVNVDVNEEVDVDENEEVEVEVEVDEREEVPVDVDEEVDVDEDEEVEVDECEEVPVDVDEEVDVDEDEEVNVDVNEEVDVDVNEEVEVEVEVEVDEREEVPVDVDEEVDVDEDEEVEVDECEEVPVDVDEEVDVDEDEEVNVDVNEEVDVDENEEVEVEVEVDEREEVPVDVDEEVDVDEDEEVEVDECEEVPVDVDEEVDVDEDEEVNVDVNEEVDVDENEEVEVEEEEEEEDQSPVYHT